MPEYDFRCTACDEVFEVSRPMRSVVAECCPSCKAPAKRIFSPVGVAFKGTGFHNTDYKQRPTEEPASTPCAEKKGASACEGCPAAS